MTRNNGSDNESHIFDDEDSEFATMSKPRFRVSSESDGNSPEQQYHQEFEQHEGDHKGLAVNTQYTDIRNTFGDNECDRALSSTQCTKDQALSTFSKAIRGNGLHKTHPMSLRRKSSICIPQIGENSPDQSAPSNVAHSQGPQRREKCPGGINENSFQDAENTVGGVHCTKHFQGTDNAHGCEYDAKKVSDNVISLICDEHQEAGGKYGREGDQGHSLEHEYGLMHSPPMQPALDEAYVKRQTQSHGRVDIERLPTIHTNPLQKYGRHTIISGQLPPDNPFAIAERRIGHHFVSDQLCGSPPLTGNRHQDFLRDYWFFMNEIGLGETKVPVIGGGPLDIFRLLREVLLVGGVMNVAKKRAFRIVGQQLDLPKTCTSAAYVLKQAYEKLLYHYERKLVFGTNPVDPQRPVVLRSILKAERDSLKAQSRGVDYEEHANTNIDQLPSHEAVRYAELKRPLSLLSTPQDHAIQSADIPQSSPPPPFMPAAPIAPEDWLDIQPMYKRPCSHFPEFQPAHRDEGMISATPDLCPPPGPRGKLQEMIEMLANNFGEPDTSPRFAVDAQDTTGPTTAPPAVVTTGNRNGMYDVDDFFVSGRIYVKTPSSLEK